MIDACQETAVLDLAKVFPHPKNYRRHTESQLLNLEESLKRFGQVRGIVVQDKGDGTYITVAGHGIAKAASRLGWKEIKAEILPKEWNESTVRGYLLADNYHSQHARDDSYLLAELFQEQVDAGYSLDTLGSSEKDLRQLFMIVQNQHETDFLDSFLKTPEERREEHKEEKKQLKTTALEYSSTGFEYPTTPESTALTVNIGLPASTTGSTQIYPSQTSTNTPPPPTQPSFWPEKLPTAEQFFPMTYSFTSDQRRLVLQCINLVKERVPGITSTDALVKICEEWSTQ